MDKPPPSMRDLARRLLAMSQTAADPHLHAGATRACERLRISLSKFAGADGFKSLLGRALALASVEAPSLRGVKIGTDARLEGFEQVAADAGTGAMEGEAAIIAYLLQLLVTFIGEPLTLRLVREAWPEVSLEKSQS